MNPLRTDNQDERSLSVKPFRQTTMEMNSSPKTIPLLTLLSQMYTLVLVQLEYYMFTSYYINAVTLALDWNCSLSF